MLSHDITEWARVNTRTKPRESPDSEVISKDSCPFTITCYSRPIMKELNHFSAVSRTPTTASLSMKRVIHIVKWSSEIEQHEQHHSLTYSLSPHPSSSARWLSLCTRTEAVSTLRCGRNADKFFHHVTITDENNELRGYYALQSFGQRTSLKRACSYSAVRN